MVLVRVVARDGLGEQGYTIAHDLIYRPIKFRVNLGGVEAGDETLPGLVLIGEGSRPGAITLEPIARMVGGCTLKILSTEELLWVPVNARRSEVDMWTVECVPLAPWLRLVSRPDDAMLRLAGLDEQGNMIGGPPQ
jgi:hypothetical protein